MIKKYWRIAVVVALTFVATWLLFAFMKTPLFNITIFDKDIMNFFTSYQLSTILISTSLLVVLFFIADKTRLSLLNLNKIDGPVRPAPWVGLKPKEGEGWKVIGLTIGGTILIVNAVVVYFQVAAKNGLALRFFPEVPMIILLALMNSFTEEVIYRLSYTTIIANEKLDPKISEFLGAVVFGGIHFFGIAPNGIFGAIMSGFIGWFLAKSINETKGFFWAWLIHFAVDVIILFFLFMSKGA